jgi:hypothetical protein
MNSNATLTEALADAYLEFTLLKRTDSPFAYMALAACEYLIDKIENEPPTGITDRGYQVAHAAGMQRAILIIEDEILDIEENKI